jgi:hypothetical protein
MRLKKYHGLLSREESIFRQSIKTCLQRLFRMPERSMFSLRGCIFRKYDSPTFYYDGNFIEFEKGELIEVSDSNQTKE